MRLEGNGVIASAEIQAGHAKRYARADSDLAENTEVIEALLGLQHVDLAQWVARFHL